MLLLLKKFKMYLYSYRRIIFGKNSSYNDKENCNKPMTIRQFYIFVIKIYPRIFQINLHQINKASLKHTSIIGT